MVALQDSMVPQILGLFVNLLIDDNCERIILKGLVSEVHYGVQGVIPIRRSLRLLIVFFLGNDVGSYFLQNEPIY